MNDICPFIGTNDEGKVKNFTTAYGGKVYVTKEFNISGISNVYVSLGNPTRSDKDFYMECDICFERNYMAKNWTIVFSGYWHYNKSGQGHSVNEDLFTTTTPTASIPTVNSNSFKRSNKKINFTYPTISTTYSGWSN